MSGQPRRTSAPLPWSEARRTAYDAAAPIAGQRRPLATCSGTVLAAPLTARNPLPPFDLAAMDGFAVAGEGPWRVVGEVLAGSLPRARLEDGTAVGIGTGAALPAGASAVLQVEHARVCEEVVHGTVAPGTHLRRTGEECAAGELLLPAGTVVTAAVLGLAAACGHDALVVRPRPRVAALVTGDELLEEGLPGGGRVRDALGPQLPVLVGAHGGELVCLAHLRDDDSLLHKGIASADADVVVITGASSVGPADHLRQVLADLDGRLLVDGVACRPGHPQLLARLPDGRLVVGLPGNPLAALVATVTVLAPLLAGLSARPLRLQAALLAEPARATASSTRLVPVRLDGVHARQGSWTGAGMLRGAALADALAVIPPGVDLPAGEQVEVLPLP